jgi:hypothetical protein
VVQIYVLTALRSLESKNCCEFSHQIGTADYALGSSFI